MMRKIWERRNAEAGSTLVELLVVIVILGILSAVAVFAVGGITDKGKQSACSTL
jgi:general secretion pathway protein G